jgi:hypothetical protein
MHYFYSLANYSKCSCTFDLVRGDYTVYAPCISENTRPTVFRSDVNRTPERVSLLHVESQAFELAPSSTVSRRGKGSGG